MKYCNVQQIYVKSLRPLIVSRREKKDCDTGFGRQSAVYTRRITI